MATAEQAIALTQLAQEIADTTEEKGFNVFNDLEQVITKLALIGTEVAEALDELRNPDYLNEDFESEIADIIIRTLDLSGYLAIDIGMAVVDKAEKNKTRPFRHNKRF